MPDPTDGSPPRWAFRHATEGDREPLWQLKRDTMRDYIAATWGWDETDQRARFDEAFAPGEIRVIQIAGEIAGSLVTEERPGELFLAKIEIAQRWQGQGIGTALVREVVERAASLVMPVTLQVLRTNPRAAALYRREGFTTVTETDTHVLMRRDP